jgi:hypothetical protein
MIQVSFIIKSTRKGFLMRVSEIKLRRIIRSILAEGYAESGQLGDSEDIPHSTDTHDGSLDDVLSMSDEYTAQDKEYDAHNYDSAYSTRSPSERQRRSRRKTNPDIKW